MKRESCKKIIFCYLLVLLTYGAISQKKLPYIPFLKISDFKNGYAFIGEKSDDEYKCFYKGQFIDVSGNIIGPPEPVCHQRFSLDDRNETFAGITGNKTFVYNGSGGIGIKKLSGEIVLEAKYTQGVHREIFQADSLFIVIETDRSKNYKERATYQLFDEKGIIIYEATGESFGPSKPIKVVCKDILAIYQHKKDAYGIDTEGYELFNIQQKKKIGSNLFSNLGMLRDGLILAQLSAFGSNKNRKWGYIDVQGNVVIDFVYNGGDYIAHLPTNFQDSRAIIYNRKGDYFYDYIDKSNKVIAEGFMEAYPFVNGYALVRVHDEKNENGVRNYGYRILNKRGEIIFDLGKYFPYESNSNTFQRTNMIDENGILRLLDKRRGSTNAYVFLYNIEENTLVKTNYETVNSFNSGLARVLFEGSREKYSRKYFEGFIDKYGNLKLTE